MIPSVFKTKRTFKRTFHQEFLHEWIAKINAALVKMYCSR